MTVKQASTFLTGGGGFNFEDAIAAYYLCAMLAERSPLGSDFGAITLIKWQGSDSDWELDDLVLVGSEQHEAGVSIKSESHLKSSGFTKDFVERCWRQYRGADGDQPAEVGELLCLAVGSTTSDVQRAWQLLSSQAQHTSPERLEKRLKPASAERGSQSSATQRSIVQSLVDHAPYQDAPTLQETLALLRQIRVLPFDFLNTPSQMEDLAVHACQFLVESGERNDAVSLWNELLAISKHHRQTGGDLSLESLLQQVRQNHKLVALPNYAPDLEKWAHLSLDRLQQVTWGVSDHIPALERPDLWEAWYAALAEKRLVVAVGVSGAGKTALVKEHARRTSRRLYLLDESLLAPAGPIAGDRFSGSAYRLSELIVAETKPAVLFVDAAEKLSEQQVSAITSVLTSVSHLTNDDHLQIVLSCQHSAVDRLRVAFKQVQFDAVFLETSQPALAEVLESVRKDARLQPLVNHDRGAGLLTHLKILELVCRAADSGVAVAEEGSLCQSDILEFLWTQWVERQGKDFVRSRLLQRLSIVDSQSLASGYALSQFDPAELERLSGLLEDGLLTRFEERIYFAHDFVGDLSRQRVLLSGDVQQATEKAGQYQWREAVRLYSQHLAEDNADRWFDAFRMVCESGERAPTCDELFIDGVVPALETEPDLLPTFWENLASLDRRFLGLLLRRITIVGTRAEELWDRQLAPEVVAHPGPWRECSGSAVSAALQLLATGDEIPSDLCSSAVPLCEMVLRRSLSVGDVPAKTARNAAELAVRFAADMRGCDDYGGDYRACAEPVYRTMLLAASQLPERVAELAVVAAQRRKAAEHPEEGVGEKADVAELPPIPTGLLSSILGDDEESEPWPDGPFDTVDSCFQKVCLESDALVALIETAPSIAREVILACAIEEPRSRGNRFYGQDDDVGIVEPSGHRPPLFDVGPHLLFFRQAPDEAIAVMLRLCNFATERWYESPARRSLEEPGAWFGSRLGPYQMKVPANDGDAATWQGSANIFRWSLGGLPPCGVVTNVLMAFEYWAYEAIRAGRSIDRYLEKVVSKGRSAGIAGCLIDIGKKHPELFLGPLRPLLGCWAFYGWDRQVRLERSGFHEGIAAWGLSRSPRRHALAAQWHKAAHRQRDLLDIARYLFIHDDDFRGFMERCRTWWENDFHEAGDHHSLRDLACVFDWNNYVIRDTDDGKREVAYSPPEDRLQEAAAHLQEVNERQLLLSFPFQCRQWLDKGEQLSQEQVDWVWSSLETIQVHDEQLDAQDDPFASGDWSRKPDALLAAAATLLCLGGQRVTEEQRSFCRHHYEAVLAEEPPRRSLDVPESVGNLSWDYFLADMAVEYLANDPNDEAARWGVERCSTAYHYRVLEHFMTLARDQRERIPDLFPQLSGYLIAWSALREQLRRTHRELSHYERAQTSRRDDPDPTIAVTLEAIRKEAKSLDERCAEFSTAVVAWNTLGADLDAVITQSLRHLREASDRAGIGMTYEPHEEDYDDSVDRADVGLDLHVLHHGFSWIDLSLAVDDHERNAWVELLSGLQTVQQRLVPPRMGNKRFSGYGYAHDFDLFLHGLLARNVVRSPGSASAAVWQVQLDRVDVAPGHVESFLDLCCAAAWDEQPDPTAFADLWVSMFGYALESASWCPEAGQPPVTWKSLVGMDFHGVDFGWKSKVSQRLSNHSQVVDRALRVAINNPSSATALIRAGSDAQWAFHRTKLLELISDTPLPWSDLEFPAEEVSQFLEACWNEHGQSIQAQPKLEGAFMTLLNKAVQAGIQSASQLAERVNASRRLQR